MCCHRSWWRDFSETGCNCQCLSFSNTNNESSIVIILQDQKALPGVRMLSYSINGSLSHIHLPLFLSMLREISCCQLFLKLFSRPVEAALDCAHRNTQESSNFLERELFIIE